MNGQWRGLALASMLLLYVAFLPASCGAEERWASLAETVFQNYGREQGLPHPVPIALAQDGDGFLWVGTQGGLARWDGYRFRAYKPDPAVPGSLPDSWIEVLHTDPHDRLWVGTGAAGLARYDRDTDRFVAVSVGERASGRIHIGAIADDDSGGLWVGTDAGLVHVDPETNATASLHHREGDPGSLPDDQVGAVLQDRIGRLWIGTAKGLARRDRGSEHIDPVPLGAVADVGTSVTKLFQDSSGRIWIGTTQRGVFVLEPGADAPRPVRETGPGPSTLESDWVSSIAEAGPFEVWVGTRGDGVVAISGGSDPAEFRTRRIRHDRALPMSLAHDDVWTLLRDAEGSMWVGGTGGLSYHARDPGTVATVFGGSSRPQGVTDPDVYALLATSDGRLWLGFQSGGVDVVDPDGGRVAQFRPEPGRPESTLPKDVVTGMAEGPGGEVFVATNRGLYHIDAAGKVELVSVPQRDPHAAIFAVLLDDGVLWLGGVEDGLWGLRIADRSLVMPPFGPDRLGDPRISCIARGAGDDLWVGTRNGLARIDLATRQVERFMPDLRDPAALPGRFVASVLLDRRGRTWVGLFGGGVAVLTGRTAESKAQFRRIGTADGLPHFNIDTLLADRDGRIWAGTDDGLAVIDPDSFEVRALHRAEGSPLADFFVDAGTVDREGEPVFGAKGGFAVVRSAPPVRWAFRPPLVVSDIRVGGAEVAGSRFNGAGSADPLVLTPQANSVVVEFSALDFTAPERNRYAYQLEGFDQDWTDTDGTRRLAAYTNLAPGSYTLRIRGSNRDGVWADRTLEIPITVLPAWYQTLWFRLAAIVAGLALVAAFVRARTDFLRRRQLELEHQIADRTSDLRAANDRLYALATTDPLTGCFNRRHFIERATELIALSTRYGSPASLVVLDVDHFKRVNDTYGHPAGDEVLRTTGRICHNHIRGTDVLGRIGGEEFAILMPHTHAAGALPLAERLREAIRNAETAVDGQSIRVTASLGLAELRPGEGFDELYARADAALYAAKQAGRDRIVASGAG